MADSARNLYNHANSARKLNLYFEYDDVLDGNQAFPSIRGVHCYQLRHPTIGAMTAPGSWAVEYHSKYAGKIILPDGMRRDRQKESVHLYSPACEYREDTTQADFPLQECYVSFHAGEAADLERLVGDAGFAIFQRAGEAGEIMAEMVDTCHSRGADSILSAQSGLLAILDILRRAKPRSDNTFIIDPYHETQPTFSDEVEEFLRRRISDKTSTADIARYMKVSESTLSHKFKSETGTSPIARLLELKIDFAKTLLIKGEPLKVIADLAGFSDEFHLSKTFKKITGQSPKDFRKEFSFS